MMEMEAPEHARTARREVGLHHRRGLVRQPRLSEGFDEGTSVVGDGGERDATRTPDRRLHHEPSVQAPDTGWTNRVTG